MFFIAGASSKREDLDFNQTIVCNNCGQYGRYKVFVEYMYLSLFFIPILKWNKKYYVKSSCCGSIYSIAKELGDSIRRGENLTLAEKDLKVIQRGSVYSIKRCSNCGFETDDDFQYCPKCANPFK